MITSGPTREFLDPVRFLSNGSSGRMGAATASDAVRRGHDVLVVSGPVDVAYPAAARVISVVTTDDMLRACEQHFADCDCLIGVAAPCDYRPSVRSPTKIAKSGRSLRLELIETPDILATLSAHKSHQRMVGFALETHDHQANALAKLRRKGCDLIVVNDAAAIDADRSAIVILDCEGRVIGRGEGSKDQLARILLDAVESILPAST
jgi:phosphopantothenoylcysteine decarboxylase/phosphopantothenate--cysteine ligase